MAETTYHKADSAARQTRHTTRSARAPHHADSAPRALREGGGRDNRDTPEGIEHQQVFVAGQDEIGATIHRQFEKLVIRLVAASHHALGDRYKLHRSRNLHQSIAQFRSDQLRDTGTCDDLEKLRLGHHGFQQHATLRGLLQRDIG